MDSYISALLDFRTTYSDRIIIRTTGEPAEYLMENFGFSQSGDRVYLRGAEKFLAQYAPALKYDTYLDYSPSPAPRGKIDEGYIACIFDHFGCYKIKVINAKNYPSIVFACTNNGVNGVISDWAGKKYNQQITLGVADIKRIYDRISDHLLIKLDSFDLLHCACWERFNLHFAEEFNK